ncbi:uncharacterized protein N7506_003939 [Penicillium brevicompactum]|uniref:uncharacterized protein n=1 Tax=Penicillium brevicompactum TaxID=5074 RepID=UPI00254146AC|nr:uncharacterized protein N7506_003939 [Penicillium brevicompactum]KAJ5335917.1 hypothetical protein N7506_003939 [Penicillium brevicompactum]
MRFLWFTAALVAGCVGAPMGSELRTRTTLNPNGDVVRSPFKVSFGRDLRLTSQANNVNNVSFNLCKNRRAGIPNKGNVDPVNDGDVTNNISFLRLC